MITFGPSIDITTITDVTLKTPDVPEASSYDVTFVNSGRPHERQSFCEFGPAFKDEAVEVAQGLAKFFNEVYVNGTRIRTKT